MSATNGHIAVTIRGLRKAFGSHEVLRGVDLDIERGRINTIIGGSGQGKSVIVKHIMGLLKPDRGQILIDGEDIVPMSDWELNRVRRKMGMLFQYSALFDSMTVEENVAFPLLEHRRDLARARVREIVQDKLAMLGIQEHALQQFPAEISGGMRKRVALARAIVMEPEILVYDEPTTGLDPIATKNVDLMIVDAAARLGVTSVVISHDMASTFRISHRVAMLYEGQIVATGTPAEMLRSKAGPLQEFIETSGVRLEDGPRA
jgi:phospholipid/cholesterol/gamma-HCH transport system ATP-binding protein